MERKPITGKLFVVATPIGNLSDISFRAIETLKNVDLIACEDTRHTKILTSKYSIQKPLVSFYSYNQFKRLDDLINRLKLGKNIALVSDSGTPGISDPGYIIIKKAISEGIAVEAIPGPSALMTALVSSGKPTNKFIFEGFLSNKASQRKKALKDLKDEARTIILYESPHRLLKLLSDILEVMGDRNIVCARELTKKFEEVKRGKTSQILKHFEQNKPRGEFIVII